MHMNAIAVRRWAIAIAPALAGILTVVGTMADPLPPGQGAELVEAYAENPGPLNIKSLAYHFAYALWLVVVFPLVGLVRGRGSWLANIAGLLAFLGISTIPGFLVTDFIDSAMGQTVGAEAAVRVGEVAQRFWAFPVMAGPGFAGLMLALPLATIAAWRAGVLVWWGAAAAVAGIAAFAVFGAMLLGNSILAAAFLVLSVALARLKYEPAAALES
jgi:hypothetical protein